eukprot:m.27198 g.27198  ORF g.27198 m.27198 type:complete len:544 (-) comp5918_c0_seq1:2054-3685(-)
MIHSQDSDAHDFPPSKMAKTFVPSSVSHISSLFHPINAHIIPNTNKPVSNKPSSFHAILASSPVPSIAAAFSSSNNSNSNSSRSSSSQKNISYDVETIRATVLFDYLPRHLKTTLQTGSLRSDARSLASRRHKSAIVRTLATGSEAPEKSQHSFTILEQFLNNVFDGIWTKIEESVDTQRQFQLTQQLAHISLSNDDKKRHQSESHKQLLMELDECMRAENWLDSFKATLKSMGTSDAHANLTLMNIVYALVSQVMRSRVKSLLMVRSRTSSNASLRSRNASRSQTPEVAHSSSQSGDKEARHDGGDSHNDSGVDNSVVPETNENHTPPAATQKDEEGLAAENIVDILLADPTELVTAICKDIISKDVPLLESFVSSADDETKQSSQFMRRQVLLAIYTAMCPTQGGQQRRTFSSRDVVVRDAMVKLCWLLDCAIASLLRKAASSKQCNDRKVKDSLTAYVMKSKQMFATWGSVVDDVTAHTESKDFGGALRKCSSKDQMRVFVTFAHRYYLSRSSHYERTRRFKEVVQRLTGKRSTSRETAV